MFLVCRDGFLRGIRIAIRMKYQIYSGERKTGTPGAFTSVGWFLDRVWIPTSSFLRNSWNLRNWYPKMTPCSKPEISFLQGPLFGISIRQVSRVYFFAMGVHVLVQVSTQCLYHLGKWNFKSDFVWKDAGHLNTHKTFYSHPNKSMISRNPEPLISWSECVFQTSLPMFTPSILKSQIFYRVPSKPWDSLHGIHSSPMLLDM